MGLFDIFKVFRGQSKVLEDDTEIRIGKKYLDAKFRVMNEHIDAYESEIESFKTRLKVIEGKFGDARKYIKEVEAERDELQEKLDEKKAQDNPEESNEARAAKELTKWGYSPDQLKGIKNWWDENQEWVTQMMEGDSEDEPIEVILRRNRSAARLLWDKDPRIGPPAGESQQQERGVFAEPFRANSQNGVFR